MARRTRFPLEGRVEVRPPGGALGRNAVVRDVGEGGLCFVSDRDYLPGQELRVRLTLTREPPACCEFVGSVVWCRPILPQAAYRCGVRIDSIPVADALLLRGKIEQLAAAARAALAVSP
jgi:Tfp pilus assembly protein PilZ